MRAMNLNLSVDEVLTTTRSVRKRLDFERPVTREVVEECLEIALQAPTGSNAQGWHWVVVEDPAKKADIAAVYRANFEFYATQARPSFPDGDLRAEQRERVTGSAQYLADHFHEAPYLLIPCITGRLDGGPAVLGASAWGSLLPAVWSFMLAARERGLGSAWTTLHLLFDGEKQVAEILGIPFDEVTQGGLFPIAYTIGTDFRPARRLPLTACLHWNGW
jgi:nitroreductase